MAEVKLENVTKRYGELEAIKDLSFEVKDKELFCILGYPGAGKTTILRVIAGLERPDEGKVFINGKLSNDIYPWDRDIAMVFQNLALYSNKTVFENLAFPLKARKMSESEIKKSVLEIAKKLQIEHTLNRAPPTLSGGEKQRVAIGRALVRQPKVFLMDEPLANLDALLRLNMRAELKRLQTELKQTIIYATHDQVEAMSMADRIAVMDRGRLQQCDTPDIIYRKPSNTFVASFIGSPTMNFIDCTFVLEGDRAFLDAGVFRLDVTEFQDIIEKEASSTELILGVRPEHVSVDDKRISENSFQAVIELFEPLGNMTVIHLKTDGVSVKAVTPEVFGVGEKMWVGFNRDKIYIFDKRTNETII